ncbi:MAG: uridine kinase [Hyphomonadaceae bacterium]
MSYIIAISGGSGSGKSTLAAGLVNALAPRTVSLFVEDAYYWPRSHYPADVPVSAINYDDPSSKDIGSLVRDLAALKSGKPIFQPQYDFETHARAEGSDELAPADIIIFEGIHTLSLPEADHLIDLRVFVDTPDDLRLARRIRRDVLERERSVESVLSQYMSTVRPSHYAHTYPAKFKADLVIADEGLPAYGDLAPTERAVARMIAPVVGRLAMLGVVERQG